MSWARQQRIIRNLEIPVISAAGAEACPPGSDARLAAIRRLLLDETFAPGDRIAGCLVTLYGQQVSTIATLRTTDTSCAGATRLKFGADWLDVPEPVATLLRQHLANRANMTTAANPDSPPSGMRTPRAMFRAPISEPDSATASSTMLSGNVPGTVRA